MSSEQDLFPNFTQLPNKLIDYIIPLLRESEEKVLLYVLRSTFGYRDKEGNEKEQDYISFSQFIGGKVSQDGRLLNFGCGVSRAKLTEALAFHQATGIIQRLDAAAGKTHPGRGGTGLYRLNRHCEMVYKLNHCLENPETARDEMVQYLNQKRLMVQKVNQIRREAKKLKAQEGNGLESEPLKNGLESEPEMVQKVNQQNKDKERKKNKNQGSPPLVPPLGEPISIDTPAAKFVLWWNEQIVPLGGRPFALDDADDKFIAKANKAIQAKSSKGYWDRVRLGFQESQFLRGECQPPPGKRRFKASLPWLLSQHHTKGTANYVLVVSGEWKDDTESTARPYVEWENP